VARKRIASAARLRSCPVRRRTTCRRRRGWGCLQRPITSAGARASASAGRCSATQAWTPPFRFGTDTGQQLGAPARGGTGSRRRGWGGQCRRETERACARTGVRNQERPGACTTGWNDTTKGDASAHHGGSPASSARSKNRQEWGPGFDLSLANACTGARVHGHKRRCVRVHASWPQPW
jgi:hypothetical protein